MLEQLAAGVALKDVRLERRTQKAIGTHLGKLRKQAASRDPQTWDATTAAAMARKKQCTPWTAEEDASLLAQVAAGVSPKDAMIERRTPVAITTRLQRLRSAQS